jgi:uncharacterized protein (DUF2267 family)
MHSSPLGILDRSNQKTEAWLGELCDELGVEDRRYAYGVLRAYLHAIRDHISVDEAAHLAAQLPHFLRGVFYEGWAPAKAVESYRDRHTFLTHLADTAQLAGETEASLAAAAATRVLARHLSEGELAKVEHLLPSSIRAVLSDTTDTGG